MPKGICTFESQQNSVKRQGLRPFILGFASPIFSLCFKWLYPVNKVLVNQNQAGDSDSTWQSSPVVVPSRWILTFGNLVNFCEECPILISLFLLSDNFFPTS